MREKWEEVPEFPLYLISNYGNVYNMRRKTTLAVSRTRQGVVKVGLCSDAYRQATKSVALLVARAFVPNPYDPELFDTPIHLDGDKANCRANNLAWRPRWFAVQYHQQFLNDDIELVTHPVEELKSTRIFTTPKEAAVINGLLVKDVILSYMTKSPTFPTDQQFAKINK